MTANHGAKEQVIVYNSPALSTCLETRTTIELSDDIGAFVEGSTMNERQFHFFRFLQEKTADIRPSVKYIGTADSVEETNSLVKEILPSLAALVFVSCYGLYRDASSRLWAEEQRRNKQQLAVELNVPEEQLDSGAYSQDFRAMPYHQLLNQIRHNMPKIWVPFESSLLFHDFLTYFHKEKRSDIPVILLDYMPHQGYPPYVVSVNAEGKVVPRSITTSLDQISADEFCFHFNLKNVAGNEIDANPLRYPRTAHYRMQLNRAIGRENYEKAAQLRDRIKEMEGLSLVK